MNQIVCESRLSAANETVIARRPSGRRSPDALSEIGVRTNKDSFNRPFRRKGRSNPVPEIASATLGTSPRNDEHFKVLLGALKKSNLRLLAPRFIFYLLPVTCYLLLSLISFANPDVIQIKGSDTMVNLGQAWAEEFMNRNPQVSMAVTGGGSGTGIAALMNGTTTIAQSSREMKPEEKAKVLKVTGKEVKEFMVALDALAVIAHPTNPVSELSIDQLSGIFTGKIVNWKELGGSDEPVLVLSRERNSGTHVYFLEEVLRKGDAKGPEEFASSALMLPSSQAIVQEVARSRSAIGYVGLGYVTHDLKSLAVRKRAEEPAFLPSADTAQSKTYPISRSLHIYTAGEPEGEVKQFIDFVLSPEGQKIVRLMDFVPLKK